MADEITSTLVTTASTTYVSGLSGFDSSALIEAAVQAELAPAYNLEADVAEDELKLAAYQEMESLVSAMEEALNALRNEPGSLADPSSFETREAYLSVDDGSTATNYLGVVVEEGLEPTSYSVEILQLASAHKIGSDSQNDQSAALGLDGSFTLASGDLSADVVVTSDMSLQDLADAINDVSDDSGVTASILKVGDENYKLILSASDTGEEISLNPLSGDDVAQSLGLLQTDGTIKTELQAAQNALISVDGVEIERSSNSIDDAIEGVTLDLYGANQGATFTLEIEYSYSDVKDNITDFVEAYNAYREFALIHQEVDSSGTVSEDAYLFGDGVLRSLNNDIYAMLTDTWEVDGETYSLSSLGLGFDDENYLEYDEDELDDFLLNNIETLAKMFEFQYDSDDENLMVLSHEGTIKEGEYTFDITLDEDGKLTSVSVDGDDSLFEIRGQTIIGVSGSDFDGMSFVYSGTESATVQISYTQGFADRLFNEFDSYTNIVDGVLSEAQSSLEEQISDAESKITEIETAAANEESRLITYYAAIEAKIVAANALADYLEAITASDD